MAHEPRDQFCPFTPPRKNTLVQPGTRAKIVDLQAGQALNGKIGTVRGIDETTCRFYVDVDGRIVKIKIENLHYHTTDKKLQIFFCNGRPNFAGPDDIVGAGTYNGDAALYDDPNLPSFDLTAVLNTVKFMGVNPKIIQDPSARVLYTPQDPTGYYK